MLDFLGVYQKAADEEKTRRVPAFDEQLLLLRPAQPKELLSTFADCTPISLVRSAAPFMPENIEDNTQLFVKTNGIWDVNPQYSQWYQTELVARQTDGRPEPTVGDLSEVPISVTLKDQP